MSNCGEKAIKFGKLCISNDDYLIIILNIIISLVVAGLFYIKRISDKSKYLSVIVKNNFTQLGEGNLNNFYSPLTTQQKSINTKKKVTAKGSQQAPQFVEKVSNNELKCNNCGRSVEVSYQYTMHKLNTNS